MSSARTATTSNQQQQSKKKERSYLLTATAAVVLAAAVTTTTTTAATTTFANANSSPRNFKKVSAGGAGLRSLYDVNGQQLVVVQPPPPSDDEMVTLPPEFVENTGGPRPTNGGNGGGNTVGNGDMQVLGAFNDAGTNPPEGTTAAEGTPKPNSANGRMHHSASAVCVVAATALIGIAGSLMTSVLA